MLNKFSGNDANKPFHSHSFADAASGESMGSTNAQSFNQRHQIDRNRQMVRRYSESFVANSGEHLRDEINKRIDSGVDQGDAKHKHRLTTRQSFNAGGAAGAANLPSKSAARPMQVPKRNFSEPPTRKYNPYG